MEYVELNAPDLTFHSKANEYIRYTIVEPKVRDFFTCRDKKFEEIIEIGQGKCITDLNFKKIKIEYIYENLLHKIKNHNTSTWNVFYTITFDKQLVTKVCDKTNLKYNEIYLGKIPVIYFIYFDLQDFYDAIRNKVEIDKSL